MEKFVETALVEIGGKNVLALIKALGGRKNVSEFKLATLTKQDINGVRNLLYKLHRENLVTFKRKKDPKKGWYIYFWTFNKKKIGDFLKIMKKIKTEELNEKLRIEKSTQWFICPNGCYRFDFEKAIEFNFRCPECGSLLNYEDNTKKIESIEKEILSIEKNGLSNFKIKN